MKHAKRTISLLLIVSLLLSALPFTVLAADNMPFTDVAKTDWFYDEVRYVYEKGMMNGTGETTFSPHATTTRGMIVTVLHRLQDEPYAVSAPYYDVAEGTYYADAVAWASNKGIVEGYGGGSFGPNDAITREQLATILFGYADLCGKDMRPRADLREYRDADRISAYALDAMQWACYEGLFEGSGGFLEPQGYATRAQVAAILMRMSKGSSLTFPVFSPNGTKPEPDSEPDFDPEVDADRYISPSLYVSNSDDDFIHFDEDSGLTYYSNELILYAVSGAGKAKIQTLVAGDNGMIVGMSGYTDSYQIRYPESLTKHELDKLKTTYEASRYVDSVFFNLALDIATADFEVPSTSFWPDWFWEGDAITMNNGNWGTKAIKAHKVWDALGDHMLPVHVGVFDCGFDVSHLELGGIIKKHSLAETENVDNINHGTHVSGTIAAKFDDTGMCGVCPTAELYLIDGASAQELHSSSYYWTFAYSYLLAESQCKVVNMSLSSGYEIAYGASHGNENALEQLAEWTAAMIIELERIEKHNRDFTICVAAGNNNGRGFFEDSNAPYGYYHVKENQNTKQLEYTDRNNQTHTVTSEQVVRGGACAAFNSALTAIPEKYDVKDRIIVVGACGKVDDKYTWSWFNSSAPGIDVMAPGEEIESCVSVDYEDDPIKDRYGKSKGTSMASPHVAGVVAMMYALDPDISAERIKEIIIETANIDVAGTDRNMVNAVTACTKVVQEKFQNEQTITGTVIDAATGKPLSGLEVAVYDDIYQYPAVASTETDASGKFALEATTGVTYYFEIRNNGWPEYTDFISHDGNTSLGTIQIGARRAFILRPTEGQVKLQDGTAVSGRTFEAIVCGEKAIVVEHPETSNTVSIIEQQLNRDGREIPVMISSQMRGPVLLGQTKDGISVWRTGAELRPDDSCLTNSEYPDITIMDHVLTWNEGDATIQQWESIKLSKTVRIWVARLTTSGTYVEELVPMEDFESYCDRYSLELHPGYCWVLNSISNEVNNEYDYCYFVMDPVS